MSPVELLATRQLFPVCCDWGSGRIQQGEGWGDAHGGKGPFQSRGCSWVPFFSALQNDIAVSGEPAVSSTDSLCPEKRFPARETRTQHAEVPFAPPSPLLGEEWWFLTP